MATKIDAPKMPRVLSRQAQEMPWQPMDGSVPGFEGVKIPGVYLKFFGVPTYGPWFYLVKHDPGTVVGRHSHGGDTYHWILEGSFKMGAKECRPGFFHFEQQGLFYGPLIAGEQGVTFLAIYTARPDFIPPKSE